MKYAWSMFWLCPKNRNPKWKVNDFFLWTMAVSATFFGLFLQAHSLLSAQQKEWEQPTRPLFDRLKVMVEHKKLQILARWGGGRLGEESRATKKSEQTKKRRKVVFLRHCCGIKSFGYFSPLATLPQHLLYIPSLAVPSSEKYPCWLTTAPLDMGP